MSGLILPDGIETDPVITPVVPNACEVVHVASDLLGQYLDELGGPSADPGTIEGQMTMVQKEVALGCGVYCRDRCSVWLGMLAQESAIELPVSDTERAHTELVTNVISLDVESEEFELDQAGELTKAIIEKTLDLVREGDPDVRLPDISDRSYQQLAILAMGNHRVEKMVIGMLLRAVSDYNNGQHMITPSDPECITPQDIRKVFAHPDMQYQLRVSQVPKSQILSVRSR